VGEGGALEARQGDYGDKTYGANNPLHPHHSISLSELHVELNDFMSLAA